MNKLEFRRGQRVWRRANGFGTIRTVDPNDDQWTYDIYFDDGTKAWSDGGDILSAKEANALLRKEKEDNG